MRKMIIGLLGSFLLSMVFAGGASAATATTPKIPTAATVKMLGPFSPEADFMSLPGYFRYLLHLQTGRWLTYRDAAQTVQSG